MCDRMGNVVADRRLRVHSSFCFARRPHTHVRTWIWTTHTHRHAKNYHIVVVVVVCEHTHFFSSLVCCWFLIDTVVVFDKFWSVPAFIPVCISCLFLFIVVLALLLWCDLISISAVSLSFCGASSVSLHLKLRNTFRYVFASHKHVVVAHRYRETKNRNQIRAIKLTSVWREEASIAAATSTRKKTNKYNFVHHIKWIVFLIQHETNNFAGGIGATFNFTVHRLYRIRCDSSECIFKDKGIQLFRLVQSIFSIWKR